VKSDPAQLENNQFKKTLFHPKANLTVSFNVVHSTPFHHVSRGPPGRSQLNVLSIHKTLDTDSVADTGQCTAGNRNNPEATQAIDSISHLYSNKSTDDTPLTESTDSLDPTTPGSDNIDRTQPPQTDNTENPSQYRAESGWSEFNACDPMPWGHFTMPDQYDSRFNTESRDWSLMSNDWNLFNGTSNAFPNDSACNS